MQWDKEDCADLGIIKIDLLGLGMMAVLEEAIPLVREHRGRRSRPRPSAGRRSRGLRDAFARRHHRGLPGREPRADGDAAADEAAHVLRPGGRGRDHPARTDRRQNGPSLPRPAHRPAAGRLRPSARSSRFCAARSASRFSRSSCCGWRWRWRASAAARPRSCGARWVSSARRRGWRRSSGGCARGWRATGSPARPPTGSSQSITSFALYGFPESHAASFALIAYASACLKCHHPAAFFAAMLNCYPLGFYHPSTLVKDAERHGVTMAADRRDPLGLALHAGTDAFTLFRGCRARRFFNPLAPFRGRGSG